MWAGNQGVTPLGLWPGFPYEAAITVLAGAAVSSGRDPGGTCVLCTQAADGSHDRQATLRSLLREPAQGSSLCDHLLHGTRPARAGRTSPAEVG